MSEPKSPRQSWWRRAPWWVWVFGAAWLVLIPFLIANLAFAVDVEPFPWTLMAVGVLTVLQFAVILRHQWKQSDPKRSSPSESK